jgi:hypothetical protein
MCPLQEPEADATPSAKPKKPKKPTHEYELEVSHEDIMFEVFIFFKEVNNLSGYVQSLWKDCREGKLDLMSAAVTTDTAFNMLKRMSEEARQSIPGNPGYTDTVGLLTEYFAHMGSTESIDFLDWTCLTVLQILLKYEDVLKVSELPILKPGQIGIYQPTRNRATMSDQERQMEDMIVMMELLTHFTYLQIFCQNTDFPLQDELTLGLRRVMEERTVRNMPMHIIFSAQILLDIHHVLREHASRPFQQLYDTSKRAVATLDTWLRFSWTRHASTWPSENDDSVRNFKGFT